MTNGSRFWVLAEDGDSDSETGADGATLSGTRSEIVDVPNPLANAERWGPPTALGAPRFAPPNSVSAGGGRASRSGHPKSMRGGASAGRPWRGPLPPARASPARSLGDLWVVDRRSGAKGGCLRLAELLKEDVGRRPPAVQSETAKVTSEIQDPNSNTVRSVVVPVGLNGPKSWNVLGCGWAGKCFHVTRGAGTAFPKGRQAVRFISP